MHRRMFRTGGLLVGLLTFGLVAAPALAQDAPEGFTTESCGEDIVLSAPEGFTLDELPADLSLAEICSIYGAEVLDVTEEKEKPTDEEREDDGGLESVEPAQVLGVSLARTGIDAGLLVVMGLGIVGLGIVAVRRPGRDREATDV